MFFGHNRQVFVFSFQNSFVVSQTPQLNISRACHQFRVNSSFSKAPTFDILKSTKNGSHSPKHWSKVKSLTPYF